MRPRIAPGGEVKSRGGMAAPRGPDGGAGATKLLGRLWADIEAGPEGGEAALKLGPRDGPDGGGLE